MKHLYRIRTLTRPALALALVFAAVPALAQYDTGVTADVPFVESGVITLDGNADEEAWDGALVVNLTDNWDPYGTPEPDVTVMGRLLYTEGALFVHVLFQDYQDFYWGGELGSWAGEHGLATALWQLPPSDFNCPWRYPADHWRLFYAAAEDLLADAPAPTDPDTDQDSAFLAWVEAVHLPMLEGRL